MKIALVADTFPPLRTSGAVQLRDLSREFARQGHDLTVFLPDSDIDRPWHVQEWEDVRIVRLRAPTIKDLGYARRTLNEFLMPFAMLRNFRKSPLVTDRWDAVIWYSPSIFHAPFVRALKATSRCKGYLIIRDIFPEWALDLGLLRKGLIYSFFRRVAENQYRQADIIGVQTPGNIKYFDRWAGKSPDRVLEVLPNWLDKPVIVPSSIRIDQTPLCGRKVLVYAGNMGVAQGMDIILQLADRMQKREDLGFLFVGRGGDTLRLRNMAQSLELKNVLFHDEIEPDEIPELYTQCHVGIVALNHQHKSHNIPGKFLTYIRSGIPVLANVNPGNDLITLIAEEGVGEACETNDIDDLEAQCLKLLERIERETDIKAKCESAFERHFSVAHIVEAITATLR
ncbi:glycosyltransferase WbuB [Tsuneonella suprasediminis]|uniref:Glycosyltransferase WbuB n=1 Tax=Tsuneonella suprasediminis TaxID=2306996 RepID=A0A419QXX8_9SPHN|nr:glycosyltransferase family 4 protein [Tsuneonella suprasediminis]RJX65550.1 glycosyltransferase WbuB [Tsuneonella suprasediminis]